jgi:transcriptional regulator with XRE-family HTH domain
VAWEPDALVPTVVPVPRKALSPLSARLAASLRRERKRRNWTQEQAAERCGLATRHLQKLEAGTVNVTIRTIERLCRAYGVDVGRFFN